MKSIIIAVLICLPQVVFVDLTHAQDKDSNTVPERYKEVYQHAVANYKYAQRLQSELKQIPALGGQELIEKVLGTYKIMDPYYRNPQVAQEYEKAAQLLFDGLMHYMDHLDTQTGDVQVSINQAEAYLKKYPNNSKLEKYIIQAKSQGKKEITIRISRSKILSKMFALHRASAHYIKLNVRDFHKKIINEVKAEDSDLVWQYLNTAKHDIFYKNAGEPYLEKWLNGFPNNLRAQLIAFELYPKYAKTHNKAFIKWIDDNRIRLSANREYPEIRSLYKLLTPDQKIIASLIPYAFAELEKYNDKEAVSTDHLYLDYPTVLYLYEHAWSSNGLSRESWQSYRIAIKEWKGTQRLLGIWLLLSIGNQTQATNLIKEESGFILNEWSKRNLGNDSPERDILIESLQKTVAIDWWMNHALLLAFTPELYISEDMKKGAYSRFSFEISTPTTGMIDDPIKLRGQTQNYLNDIAGIQSLMWQSSNDPKKVFQHWSHPDRRSTDYWNKLGLSFEKRDQEYMSSLFSNRVSVYTRQEHKAITDKDIKNNKDRSYAILIRQWPQMISNKDSHNAMLEIATRVLRDPGLFRSRKSFFYLFQYLYIHEIHDISLKRDEKLRNIILKFLKVNGSGNVTSVFAASVLNRIYGEEQKAIEVFQGHAEYLNGKPAYYLWNMGYQQLMMINPQHPAVLKKLAELEDQRQLKGVNFVIWWIKLHQGFKTKEFPVREMSELLSSAGLRPFIHSMRMNLDILRPYSKQMRTPSILKGLVFMGSPLEQTDRSYSHPTQWVKRRNRPSNAWALRSYLGMIDQLHWRERQLDWRIRPKEWQMN